MTHGVSNPRLTTNYSTKVALSNYDASTYGGQQ